jgi:hypothetical protein
VKPRSPALRIETALLATIHSRAWQPHQKGWSASEAAAGSGVLRPGLRSHGSESGGAGEDGPTSVLRIDPRDGAVCVFRDTPVVAYFSRPLDPAGVSAQTFRVLDDQGAVSGHVRLSPDACVLMWKPDGPLAANVHHFVISSGLRDTRSREVSAHLSRFLTCDLMLRDISG